MPARDENGKFKKGNGGGPGRPPKKREDKYLHIAMNTCTYVDWQRIITKAVEQAKKGDSVARKWLADYLIGPPVQKNENENTGEMIFRVVRE